jgi:hypothetical protein
MQVQTFTATARLRNVQLTRLAATGLGIDPPCEHDLDQLVSTAGAQLDSQRAAVEQVDEAAANLGKLIDAMADEARTQGSTTMQEWSLRNALGRLCPLFPFC